MGKSIKYPEIHSEIIPDKLIVTEKIHGSNFGIGYVNGSLWIQSRNETIDRNSLKFNMGNIIDKLIELVKKLKYSLKCNFLVYGEIFGHMSKKDITYYDKESKEVFGSSITFFRAFDIYDTDKREFWKYSDAIQIFKQIGLPYVPILDIKYEEIGELYDLVERYKSAYSEEPVEGFVLKKDEIESYNSRTIFKVKREKFNDKMLNKYKVKNYVTRFRFVSAYSKIGEYDLEKIKEEMIKDSLKDIMSVFQKEIEQEVEQYLKKNPVNKVMTDEK